MGEGLSLPTVHAPEMASGRGVPGGGAVLPQINEKVDDVSRSRGISIPIYPGLAGALATQRDAAVLYSGRKVQTSYADQFLSYGAHFSPTLADFSPTVHLSPLLWRISLLRCTFLPYSGGFLSYAAHFSPTLADFSPTVHLSPLLWRISLLRCTFLPCSGGFLSYGAPFSPTLADFSPTVHISPLLWRISLLRCTFLPEKSAIIGGSPFGHSSILDPGSWLPEPVLSRIRLNPDSLLASQRALHCARQVST